MDDRIAEAADALRYDHATSVDVADRALVLTKPVAGDPGAAVLRVLGLAQAASPVGGAAAGPAGVAIGVWRAPELYLARWTRGKRWVVGFRLTGTTRLRDYIGMEGRVPTRFETGNWYGDVPDEVAEAFLEAGLLVDEPPFPVPKPAVSTPSSPPPSEPRRRRAPASRPAGTAPATRSRATSTAPATRKGGAGPSTRLCPSCRMHKAVTQFVTGSDLCVDCR